VVRLVVRGVYVKWACRDLQCFNNFVHIICSFL